MSLFVESGLQLLARLSGPSTFDQLEETLFFNGLRSRDIVEIGGGVSCGKTLLLCHLLAKCILPSHHREFSIRGCDSAAVLIDTDHHFQVSKLVDIMSALIREACKMIDEKTVSDIVTESLENLTVVECYNSNQFSMTLHTLENVLHRERRVALLAIDSISAYYWEDREGKNLWSLDAHIKTLLKIAKKQALPFNVVTVYTTYGDVASRETDTTQKPNYRICLHRNPGDQKFLCVLESGQETREIEYTIDDTGIRWGCVKLRGKENKRKRDED